jgi:hypothetical protein
LPIFVSRRRDDSFQRELKLEKYGLILRSAAAISHDGRMKPRYFLGRMDVIKPQGGEQPPTHRVQIEIELASEELDPDASEVREAILATMESRILRVVGDRGRAGEMSKKRRFRTFAGSGWNWVVELQPVIPLTVADLRARLLPGGLGRIAASSTIGNADLGGPPCSPVKALR